MKYDVFISYSSKDQKVAEDICGYLERYGLRCFVAYRDIPKPSVFAAVITSSIVNSAMMVAVFSQNFNTSKEVDREIKIASDNNKAILTYRITDDPFSDAKEYYLCNLNWIDAFPNPQENFGELYDNVCKFLGKTSLPEAENERKAREESARFKDKTFTVNGVSFEMVAVNGGTFTMGATPEQGSDAYDWEKPTHSVTLGDYHIGKFEVTQELWEAVMGSNPSYFKGSKLPVEQVNWDDCQTFIRKLNSLTGKNFRLPTEAEWEYAARGGNRSRGYKYSGSNSINDVAWFWENSGDRVLPGEWDYDKITKNNCKTHPVGTKSPNELGIYDMSGNVWEWCQDRYGSYSSGSQTNPQGASSGSGRVLRGGSWDSSARLCRVSIRDGYAPDDRYNGIGFRLVLVP